MTYIIEDLDMDRIAEVDKELQKAIRAGRKHKERLTVLTSGGKKKGYYTISYTPIK